MKRFVPLIFAAIALASIVTACRQYLPQNRYLVLRAAPQQSTADARGKFSHEHHAKPLATAGITCADCHRFDARIDASSEELADEVSAAALYPDGTACHFCHRDGATRMAAAPSACTTCHENLEPLRPVDHDVAWMKVHGSMARTDPQRCESCHRQAQCISCHQSRDSIQTLVHERNFRFFHSVEARANPMKCGSCHREDFCIQCHRSGGLEGPKR